jgi:hypothetical protein
VRLLDATSDSPKLPAASIDAVCAINNVQLWQPLPTSLAIVYDLLRPDGIPALGLTEYAVLPVAGGVGRKHDVRLLPHLYEGASATRPQLERLVETATNS